MWNQGLDTFFADFDFLGHFGGKIGSTTTRTSMGLAFMQPVGLLPHWMFIVQTEVNFKPKYSLGVIHKGRPHKGGEGEGVCQKRTPVDGGGGGWWHFFS